MISDLEKHKKMVEKIFKKDHKLTENQKDLCKGCLEEFLTNMQYVTNTGSIPIVRVCGKIDRRKKDQEFKIEIHFRSIV